MSVAAILEIINGFINKMFPQLAAWINAIVNKFSSTESQNIAKQHDDLQKQEDDFAKNGGEIETKK